ncbi:MAG: molybdopterin-synthase adenylyltransferase MoeB [Verrucomicrobia bacterium]|nr:MAG: molybdopterin-synthase adenylyltransferase MoeB [Verrucomicrobiota bacterium]
MTTGLNHEEIRRYARHLILPQVGLAGQQKIRRASVLIVGAGGLGAPIALYLAAAGIGRLGIVDFDAVELSNLQRQVLHGTPDLGRPKAESARDAVRRINPHVEVDVHATRLTAANAMDILRPYDVVVDGTDNFPTRYLTNDACVLLGKPNVYGSIFRFEGQASVFAPHLDGPCYRCLYPEPPPPGSVPTCAEGGVLGVLPGIIGVVQATEILKLILGEGRPLIGRLLLYDALEMRFRELKVRRDPACPVCGENPTIRELIDYEAFCAGAGREEEPPPPEAAATVPEITVQELKAALDDPASGVQLIDVREPVEHRIVTLPGSRLIPLGELPRRLDELDRDRPCYVICHHGVRSIQAAAYLAAEGFRDARSVRGGLMAWAEEIDPSLPRY